MGASSANWRSVNIIKLVNGHCNNLCTVLLDPFSDFASTHYLFKRKFKEFSAANYLNFLGDMHHYTYAISVSCLYSICRQTLHTPSVSYMIVSCVSGVIHLVQYFIQDPPNSCKYL